MSSAHYTEGSGRISGNVWWSDVIGYRVHGVLEPGGRVVTMKNGRRTIRVQVGKKAVVITSTYPDDSETLVVLIPREEDSVGQ